MTKITKEQVLENLEDVKKYVNEAESEAESEVEGIAIKNWWSGEAIFQSTKTTLKEAVEEAVENGENLHYADLCDADLSGTDLRGADLLGAKLSGANLHEANLCDADLSEADLRGADLHYVKFYGRGGTTKIKKSQTEDFFKALGIEVVS